MFIIFMYLTKSFVYLHRIDFPNTSVNISFPCVKVLHIVPWSRSFDNDVTNKTRPYTLQYAVADTEPYNYKSKTS